MFESVLLTIYSARIERAVAFWRDLMGFAETYRFPPSGLPAHVELGLHGSRIAFSSGEGRQQHHLPAFTPGNPFEIGLRVADMDAVLARLAAAGVTPTIPPFTSAAGNRVAYIADPDGTRIQLYQVGAVA